MPSDLIRPAQPADAPVVRHLIHTIWREFDDFGDPALEPDLLDPSATYSTGASRFWVAEATAAPPSAAPLLAGCLALADLGHGNAALKRMYVLPPFRGDPHRIGVHLLAAALAHAHSHGIRTLYLGTMDLFTRSHAFYTRNGFHPVARESLPLNFPLDPADTLFFARHL